MSEYRTDACVANGPAYGEDLGCSRQGEVRSSFDAAGLFEKLDGLISTERDVHSENPNGIPSFRPGVGAKRLPRVIIQQIPFNLKETSAKHACCDSERRSPDRRVSKNGCFRADLEIGSGFAEVSERVVVFPRRYPG